MTVLRIDGSADLHRLAADLQAVDLVSEMRRELVPVAPRVLADVRAGQAAIPSRGGKHTGLRRRLQAATTARVETRGDTARIRVAVNPGAMPAGQRTMPRAMEGSAFAHPRFGDRTPMIRQPGHPYLGPAMQRNQEQIRAAAVRAANNVSAKLSRRK